MLYCVQVLSRVEPVISAYHVSFLAIDEHYRLHLIPKLFVPMIQMCTDTCWLIFSLAGGHRVSVPLTHVAVSMRDHLLYRDPGWRLLENGVAMATASRERCCLVSGVTPLIEGRVWRGGEGVGIAQRWG